MANLCGKRVTPENAYEVWQNNQDGTQFFVLKKYQADDNKPYARWLVASTNQFNSRVSAGSDGYVVDIKANAHKLDKNPLAKGV